MTSALTACWFCDAPLAPHDTHVLCAACRARRAHQGETALCWQCGTALAWSRGPQLCHSCNHLNFPNGEEMPMCTDPDTIDLATVLEEQALYGARTSAEPDKSGFIRIWATCRRRRGLPCEEGDWTAAYQDAADGR